MSDADPNALAWCGVGARVLGAASDFARRGEIDALRTALEKTPDLTRATYGAQVLSGAVLAGRVQTVELLLREGVDPNKPHHLPTNLTPPAFERVLFVTPLCAARLKRRSEVEELLLQNGAVADIFTSAFLGDAQHVEESLRAEPGLAQATDPALDVLDITPVHHAIAGKHPQVLEVLLSMAERPLLGGTRALRAAVGHEHLGMVQRLLEWGVSASELGAGRWVLNEPLALLLSKHGASIDRSGAWIGLCCTGNQGRKDDPDFVRSLLRYGARADDRRSEGLAAKATGTVVAQLNATALHYAAKAGFLKTIAILLEHGADPQAVDSRGETPLDWLEGSAKSVDRSAVKALLAARGRSA
jgi:ankyrin repeat protein